MVGTNRMDYEARLGLSRTFAGHGSDGLVRIDNAALCGLDARGKPTAPCVKAFTYRAHSGCFGIVNSRRKGLAYTLTLNVRVPDYEVERKLWVNQRYEGSYLFRNSLALEITPTSASNDWQVSHAW